SLFNAPLATNLPANVVAEAVGHFRDNGPLDVVAAHAGGSLSVVLGNGDGTLRSPVDVSGGDTPSAAAVGALLGNGHQYIVTTSPGRFYPTTTDGSLSVVLGNGDGTFQAAKTLTVTGHLGSVALGDVFGGGRMDIITSNTNGTLSVYRT